MGHPVENDLALLAGGETGRAKRFLLERHVRGCEQCQTTVTQYQALRAELFDTDLLLPEVNWNLLAAEMRANIRLGLEAGACVRETHVPRRWSFHLPRHWNPGLTTAFALMVLLVGSAYVVRNPRPLLRQMRWDRPGTMTATVESDSPVLESNGSGVEFRTGGNSLTLLNHHGNAANQTMSAQGDVGTRYIDETGSVTITNVYLPQ
jgi:hypothetical protein